MSSQSNIGNLDLLLTLQLCLHKSYIVMANCFGGNIEGGLEKTNRNEGIYLI